MFNSERLENEPFIIAEVGQNHQGDFELAKKYIKIFADAGASAIKFQIRDNKNLFSEDAYLSEYKSENAFGNTYGEHREKLELNPNLIIELKKKCHEHNVAFMATPFDEGSLRVLDEADVDVIKIASFDLGNLPFISRVIKTNKPIVMSIGGGKHDQIRSSVDLIKSNHNQLVILHCVSEYPCEFNRLGLENIALLKQEFRNTPIGSSDHFNGILSGPIAYMMGARVFEKHVTLNRSWRGTDHNFALEPEGFRKFVRDIKRVKHMLPQKNLKEIGEEAVFKKLGKSLVANEDLKINEVITLENISGKIFKQQYIPVRESNELIGRILLKNVKKGEPIDRKFLM